MRAEPRFHTDTVQKAVALAQRLQNERRETLSLSEIDQIAAEIGIDPSILRHALDAIAQKEAAAAAAVRSQMTVHGATAKQNRRAPVIALSAALFFGVVLMPWLYLRASMEPPPEPPRMVAPQVASQVAPAAISNGGFELGPAQATTISAGSEALPGWSIMSGQATYLPGAVGANSPGALQLGEGGSVRQLFETQPGQSYRLTLRVSGVPKNVNIEPRVEVLIGNISTEVKAFTRPRASGEVKWTEGILPFRAGSTGTSVVITNRSPAIDGTPIIDDVTLTPVTGSHFPMVE